MGLIEVAALQCDSVQPQVDLVSPAMLQRLLHCSAGFDRVARSRWAVLCFEVSRRSTLVVSLSDGLLYVLDVCDS